MKRFLTIWLLLISCLIYGQQSIEGIPEVNHSILISTDSYIGRKVGTGICHELIDSVLIKIGIGQHENGGVGYDAHSLNPKKERIYPGDIVYLLDLVLKGYSTVYDGHIAFVYGVLGKDKYYIVHQNFNVDNLSESVVVVTVLDLSKVKKGKVQFWRPVTATASGQD